LPREQILDYLQRDHRKETNHEGERKQRPDPLGCVKTSEVDEHSHASKEQVRLRPKDNNLNLTYITENKSKHTFIKETRQSSIS
jgi:hypothetical protein